MPGDKLEKKVAKLSTKVDEKLLRLNKDNLREIGTGLNIRAGRLVNQSKVVLLREISNFVEKKCSESVETALDLLTPLYNDIIERLTKEPNQNSDTSDNDSDLEFDNSQSDGSSPENQKNSSSNSGSDKE